MTRAGLPHSEIPGSEPVCGYPRLIAAYHVLHRFSTPRHPPCALTSLTIETHSWEKLPCEYGNRTRLVTHKNIPYSIVNELSARLLPDETAESSERPRKLVELTRLELVTPCLQSRCSPN